MAGVDSHTEIAVSFAVLGLLCCSRHLVGLVLVRPALHNRMVAWPPYLPAESAVEKHTQSLSHTLRSGARDVGPRVVRGRDMLAAYPASPRCMDHGKSGFIKAGLAAWCKSARSGISLSKDASWWNV